MAIRMCNITGFSQAADRRRNAPFHNDPELSKRGITLQLAPIYELRGSILETRRSPHLRTCRLRKNHLLSKISLRTQRDRVLDG